MRGHIRKRGNSWAVVVDAGRDEDGRRRQRWHSDFRTKREANEALTEILGQLASGQYVAPSKLSVGGFLEDEWLPAVRGRLRPLTFESYAGNIRNHVVPRLGSVPMQQLTSPMLNTMYVELGATLSPRTVRYIHSIVRRALADAIKWNRLTRNPADTADPPSSRAGSSSQMKTWSGPELGRFLDSVRDDRLYACWHFLAMTGCRRGEALGIRWRDLDLENGRATIVQSVVANRAIAETKTERGRRTLALDAGTVAALVDHREAQLQERALLGQPADDRNLVFCNPDGTPIWPRSMSRAFANRVDATDLPRVRLHDLRHGHATLALLAGVHPKVVQERLGHATISITLDVYSHAIPAMQEDAAARVAALVEPMRDAGDS